MMFSPDIQAFSLILLAIVISTVGLKCLQTILDDFKYDRLTYGELWTLCVVGSISWGMQMFALLAFYVQLLVGTYTLVVLAATILGGVLGFRTIHMWLEADRINSLAFTVLTLGGQVGLPVLYVAVFGIALAFT
jgi:hypothetical protein